MTRLPRKLARVALLLTLSASLSHCAAFRPPDTVVTTPGRSAWYAQRVVLAFESLVDGAIGLNKLPLCIATPGAVEAISCRPTLSDASTRLVLDVSRRTVVTLGKTPEGARPVAAQGILEIRTKLDSDGRSQIGAWLEFVEGLLKEQP